PRDDLGRWRRGSFGGAAEGLWAHARPALWGAQNPQPAQQSARRRSEGRQALPAPRHERPRHRQGARCRQTLRRSLERRLSKSGQLLKRRSRRTLDLLSIQDRKGEKTVRTTNAIEPRFREVRRTTRPMGIFQDKTSRDRILFAVFTHENKSQG